jgi:nitrite reductase/ring-hydroxylating ferredoxin subunit
VAPGAVVSRRAFGREMVVFRTRAGQPGVLPAHCPHLGAHLGQGGRVDDEAIRCPMHGFRFDPSGACLSTPYGARVPPTARAQAVEVRERNGFLLAWHDDAGRPPSFEVPEIATDGFDPPLTRTLGFRGHPQETTENGVDLGHLGEVHGYRDVEVRRELRLQEASLSVSYAMSRRPPWGLGGPVRAAFDVHVYGLGFSWVEVRVEGTDVHTHHFVSSTPVDAGRCEMRVAMRIDRATSARRVHPLLALLPPALGRALVARAVFEGFVGDIEQDIRVWEHKSYLDHPALAEGDGPIGRFRQWARQFYAALPEPALRSPT